MPAGAGGPDQRAVDAAGRRLGLGGGADRGLDVAALGVEGVEAGGKGGRLVRVVGREESGAEVGRADAAAGVDPRTEDEAERVSRWRTIRDSRLRARAVRPGRALRAITVRPWRTKARLRPVSGATSATVASATRSRKPRRSGPVAPSPRARRLTATSIRKTTAAAQR